MSEQENVQTIQRIYENFGRGDIQAVLNALADDVAWFVPGPAAIPYAGRRRGRQELAQFFGMLGGAVEFEEFEPREFIAQGDTVVALGQDRRRARSTGKMIENKWAMVWKLRDGKVASFHAYEDTADAAAAFGGS